MIPGRENHPMGNGMSRFACSPNSRSREPFCDRRHPGLLVFMVAAALIGGGCVEVGGRYYWTWNEPGSAAISTCTAIQPGSGSTLRIVVRDELQYAIPGVNVLVWSHRPATQRPYETDSQGIVNAWLEPRLWQVEAGLPGFRPGSYSLQLLPDHSCKVTFHLRLETARTVLDHNDDLTRVASAGLAYVEQRRPPVVVVMRNESRPAVGRAISHLRRVVRSEEVPKVEGYTMPAGYFYLDELEVKGDTAVFGGQIGLVPAPTPGFMTDNCGTTFAINLHKSNGRWVVRNVVTKVC